jgi:hypothetical protein
MRKLAHLIVALCLVSTVACSDDEKPTPEAGAGGASGSGGSNSGGQGGAGGAAGATGGSSGASGASGEGGGDGGAGEGGSGDGGAGEGGTGGGDATPLEDLPDEFAGALCEALEDCLGPTKLREELDREDCTLRVAAELRADDLAYVDMSISAGRLIYEPSQLAECLDGVREMGCAVLTDTYPDACGDLLAGNVPEGGECVASSECEGPAFCAGRDACPSTCQALLEEGDDCLDPDDCGDDLWCIGGKCAPFAQRGDACAGDSGGNCAFGLSCLGSTDTEAGTCETNATVQAGALDEACEPGGVLCEEGLSCVFNGLDAFHCQGPAEAGGACYLGLPGQCPPDQYCDVEDDVTIESTCKALPEVGDTCALGYLCEPGAVCLPDGDSSLCHAIEENGGDCADDAACRSRHCAAGKCEAPEVCL